MLALLAILVAGSLAWGLTPLGPGADALSALEGGEGVTVLDVAYGYEFAPEEAGPVGVLIYPGGRVDARSYAPLQMPSRTRAISRSS